MTKEEKKEYMKKWNAENKDKIKAINKRYYEKHKEQQKEYQKRWNEKNKEKVKEIQRNYYINHKEEILKQNKEWRNKNKKQFSKLCSESRKRRVEKLRSEGVVNAWSVVVNGKQPKYKVSDN